MSADGVTHQIEIVSDLVLSIAYYIIPLQLMYFLRRIPVPLPHKAYAVLVLFACFILLCGTTHLIHMLELALVTASVVKAITAGVSTCTALLIWWVFRETLQFLQRARQVEMDLFHQASEIKRAQELIKETQTHKDDFMAVISHELRNALQVIIANTQFLVDTPLVHEQYEYAMSVQNSAKLMCTIVSDVLDISRLQAGKMSFEKECFSLLELCEQVVRNYQPQADEKRVALHLEYDASAPYSAISDPLRIQQILINLIGNALKFTLEGSVTLRVSSKTPEPPGASSPLDGTHGHRRLSNSVHLECHATWTNYAAVNTQVLSSADHASAAAFVDAPAVKIKTRPPPSVSSSASQLFDQNATDELKSVRIDKIPPTPLEVTFQVIDTGIGISTTALPTLFQAYTQGKLSTVRTSGGSGLGLSIVQQIVSNLHGAIYVISQIGQGSMFVVQLPLPTYTREQFQHVHAPVEVPPIPLPRQSHSKPDAKMRNLPLLLVRQQSFSHAHHHRRSISAVTPDPLNPRIRQNSISGISSCSSKRTGSNACLTPIGARQLSNDPTLPRTTTGLGPRTPSGGEQHPSLFKPLTIHTPNSNVTGKSSSPPASTPALQQRATHLRRDSAPNILVHTGGETLMLLCVDDNAVNLKILKRLVSAVVPSAHIDLANDGLEALDRVRDARVPYSCILMDLDMPRCSGFEATERLRASGHMMPIVAVTANILKEERTRAHAVGFSDFTTKPISKSEIGRLLHKWLPSCEIVLSPGANASGAVSPT